NDGGTAITVEVGRDVSDNQAYVRLGGAGAIYVVSTSLGKLLKERAIEYRDQKLFDFQAENVKRLEIEAGSDNEEPARYVLVRSDSGWVFESPAKARAVADKIDAAVQAMSGLRVSGWVTDEAENPAMYGLGDAGLTIRATVEERPEPAEAEADADADEGGEGATEEAPAEGEDEDAEQPEEEQPAPAPVITEYVLHVSGRSPIGEETKVYVSKGGEPVVGTVAKTISDRLTPNLQEWRDMRLTTAAVTTADRIELTMPTGGSAFALQEGKWVDANSGSAIDAKAVTELLKQIQALEARSFVEIEGDRLGDFGLDQPQVEIRLNVPGEARSQRFTVGGYTDPQARRMVYVRADQADAVAKVRVGETGNLTRDPAEYRDRTIFDLNPKEIARIAITREDELTGAPFAFALTGTGGELAISEPVLARTAGAEAKKLSGALARLKAVRVVGEADAADYGLDAPEISCEITRQPPEITKYIQVEPEEAEGEEAEAAQPESSAEPGEKTADEPAEAPKSKPRMRVEKYQPPAEHYRLLVSEHEGKVYAASGEGTVYEAEGTLLELLRAEYHDAAILEFEPSQVVSVTVTAPEGTAQTFAKKDDQWQCASEPDLPIDLKKVTDLLLRIKDLRTERYVVYGEAELGAYGLGAAWRSVTVELEDGTTTGLIVSAQTCEKDEQRRRYARTEPYGDGVFLVSEDTTARFEIDLAEFEAP
ncbi:MAG TPA: DUF4340 domain-containing protein, partial [Phycisphaerae bacterium]|nr:DUF4340 domain-containing protein [Phycisphaerae bacterium]